MERDREAAGPRQVKRGGEKKVKFAGQAFQAELLKAQSCAEAGGLPVTSSERFSRSFV